MLLADLWPRRQRRADNSDVLIKCTYYGDDNLNGKVDGSDFSRIDSGFLRHSSGWFNGDFNYDGVVNGSDYTLIDSAYNQQVVSLAAQIMDNKNNRFFRSSASTMATISSQREWIDSSPCYKSILQRRRL